MWLEWLPGEAPSSIAAFRCPSTGLRSCSTCPEAPAFLGAALLFLAEMLGFLPSSPPDRGVVSEFHAHDLEGRIGNEASRSDIIEPAQQCQGWKRHCEKCEQSIVCDVDRNGDDAQLRRKAQELPCLLFAGEKHPDHVKPADFCCLFGIAIVPYFRCLSQPTHLLSYWIEPRLRSVTWCDVGIVRLD